VKGQFAHVGIGGLSGRILRQQAAKLAIIDAAFHKSGSS